MSMAPQCFNDLLFVIFILCAMLLMTGASAAPYLENTGLRTLTVGKTCYNESMEFDIVGHTLMNGKSRYVIDGLEKGKRYFILLSYLGSPSIQYNIYLGHLPRLDPETKHAGGHHNHRLADTSIVKFETHSDGLFFNYIDGDGGVIDSDITKTQNSVPVIEVRGIPTGFPEEPEKWRVLHYNLRIDVLGDHPFIFGTLSTMLQLPILWLWHFFFIIVIVVSGTWMSPRLHFLIAGDAPPPPPRKDFVIILLDKRT